jgi:TPP-dependent indolepyruvate ferredoxin oxidoreductase alpha subunit
VKTPSTTPNQIVALITAVVGLFVAFGLVDNGHAQAIIGAAAVIVPTGLLLADSIIRHGRSRALAAPAQVHVLDPRSPSSHVDPEAPAE